MVSKKGNFREFSNGAIKTSIVPIVERKAGCDYTGIMYAMQKPQRWAKDDDPIVVGHRAGSLALEAGSLALEKVDNYSML
uniref:Thiolase N-terminal domain-containing protein n=1 Tax=Romanomermis culicivorax TaxID=13658 RepID=A0A915JW48_ROMCU